MESKNKTRCVFSVAKKCIILLSLSLFSLGTLYGQSMVYDDFEGKGNKAVRYGEWGGVLDTLAKDPAPKDINAAGRCALYVRNGSKKFDNIKMGLKGNLTDVDQYATYLGIPPKLKMKIYTSAPPGTLVEILLGSKRGNNDYPAGTNSQYQAYTTVSNQWEQLEFKFSQVPQGSETSFTQIDQVTLLFNPNSANSDTYYFDELSGPPLGSASAGDSKASQPASPDDKATLQSAKTQTQAAPTPKPVSTPAPANTNNADKPKKSKSK